VLDVLVERVARSQPALRGDELRGVALVGDEEQAGVELAELVVEAVGELSRGAGCARRR